MGKTLLKFQKRFNLEHEVFIFLIAECSVEIDDIACIDVHSIAVVPQLSKAFQVS